MDALGKKYCAEVVETLRKRGQTIREIHPCHDQFRLGKATIWLVLFSDREDLFRIETCTYNHFLDEFMKSNPFRWNEPKPERRIAEQRMNPSWQYSLVYRNPATTRPLIDALATAAFESLRQSSQ